MNILILNHAYIHATLCATATNCRYKEDMDSLWKTTLHNATNGRTLGRVPSPEDNID